MLQKKDVIIIRLIKGKYNLENVTLLKKNIKTKITGISLEEIVSELKIL